MIFIAYDFDRKERRPPGHSGLNLTPSLARPKVRLPVKSPTFSKGKIQEGTRSRDGGRGPQEFANEKRALWTKELGLFLLVT